ncbi:AidA/PixA family protein [Azospirillum sp. B4]|uniref:AidA/PixA family protein n=1 Tax=Azospirillum sp. B4 TaxID=95605 RepID=UPI0011DD0B4D|nr:AidA/PixA family protein [Azospirillum sp. B4]
MTDVVTPLPIFNHNHNITIEVMTILDVGLIISKIKNKKLSLSPHPESPTPIGHYTKYDGINMVAHDPYGWNYLRNQANEPHPGRTDPGSIVLNAKVGDTVSFRSISIDGNSHYAAFIYNIVGGDPILGEAQVKITTLENAAYPTAKNGYPFAHGHASFSSCDAKVVNPGRTWNFDIYAALFHYDKSTDGQTLAGYVSWDPVVFARELHKNPENQ